MINKSKEMQERISNAIKQLKLNKKELDSISVGTMDKICRMANCKTIDLMWYLRYER